jgi:biopolymer transport protein ExbB/TolQ
MDMLTIAAALVATLFGLLVAIVSFIGSKIIHQLDTLAEKLQDIAGELHTRITGLDLRLTRVETKIEDNK